MSDAADVEWLQSHRMGMILDDAVRDLLQTKPENPTLWLSRHLADLNLERCSSFTGLEASGSGSYRIESSELMQEYLGLMELPFKEGVDDDLIVGRGEKGFAFNDINENDCLLVIDMQNDFVPKDGVFNPNGGRLAAPEGDVIAEPIVLLMKHFHEKGATVVASKDYHPKNHCSFAGHGGHLPPHCIAGHDGSKLFSPIASCLQELRKKDAQDGKVDQDSRSLVAFKGYHQAIDSFGGLKYADADTRDKFQGLQSLPQQKDKIDEGVHPEALTGCQLFNCSGDHIEGKVDVDAPPDVLVEVRADLEKHSLGKILKERNLKRMFVCGVAFDYCVLDTTCNALGLGFQEAYLIADAARPAYVPRSDFFDPPHGSGFLQDPKGVRAKIKDFGAKFCFTRHLLPRAPGPLRVGKHHNFGEVSTREQSGVFGGRFPGSLGPWKMHLAPAALQSIVVNVTPSESRNGQYHLVRDSPLKHLDIATEGVLGPLSPVNFPDEVRQRLHIPNGDIYYCFAHGLKNAAAVLTRDAKFSWCLHDPSYTFYILGGFLYFDKDKKLVAVLSLTGVGEGEQTIQFGRVKNLKLDEIPYDVSSRFQTTPAGTELRKRGAERITAVANNELNCKFGGILMTIKDGAVLFPFEVGS
eukprot:Hpha_TRINITY_DN16011_c5_g9::TRINITY_DN16011_c5_g9_i1::g.119666::m.119666